MTILEKNHDYLHVIATVCGYLNETNSSAEKTRRLMSLGDSHEALGLGTDAPDIFHKALRMTYSPYVKYGVTSENIRKFMGQQPEISFEEDEDMFMLLDDLSNNPSSGHATIKRIVHFLNSLGNDLYVETFLNIIDKNLKIRMDSKSINKACPELIPEFEVSLCKVYDDYRSKVKFEKDVWYASRKLDGCRCVVIIKDGHVTSWSRQGKMFETLHVLENELLELSRNNGNFLDHKVLDGEICIVDSAGNEDFKSIMKEIRRKDHTISNPMYLMYDMMDLDEFERGHTTRTFGERLAGLREAMGDKGKHFRVLEQIHITGQEQFDRLFAEAQENGWEGLVIRKNDNVICKRTDSMLKCKAFKDAEYVVTSVETGPFRTIVNGKEVEENVVTNFHITHRGNDVGVGSGLSLEQRRYFKEHPEELIGRTVTIQYFEETENTKGEFSLRFPTLKYIYENGRDV